MSQEAAKARSSASKNGVHDSRFLQASLVSPDQFGEFWFFNGLWGLRQPVGAGKAPTGLLTPGSGATKYIPNLLLG